MGQAFGVELAQGPSFIFCNEGSRMPQAKVALLEKHFLFREALRRALEDAGLGLARCHHQPEAFLESLVSQPPLVSLVSWSPADYDGLAIIGQAVQQAAAVPLIVVSSIVDETTEQACRAAG